VKHRSTWIWSILIGAAVSYEFWSLRKEGDADEPLTHHVRKLLDLNNRRGPLYWLLLGFWLWLGRHFFVDGENYEVN
jgi:hypothetical protein